jgi:hypothetical protein
LVIRRLGPMIVAMFRTLLPTAALIVLVATAGATASHAQSVPVTTPPPPIGAPQPTLHQWMLDQHRQALQLQRSLSDQRQAFAEQMRREAAQAALDLQRQQSAEPLPAPMAAWAADTGPAQPDLDEARAQRQTASQRRQAVVDGVTQIDTWLDRAR